MDPEKTSKSFKTVPEAYQTTMPRISTNANTINANPIREPAQTQTQLTQLTHKLGQVIF